MKKFSAVAITIALVLTIIIIPIGCSCGKSSKPHQTPTPTVIITPTPTPSPTPTPTPTRPRPSQAEYDETRDTIVDTVARYVADKGGVYPPKVGDININGETRSIIDLCSCLESNGGSLTQIPKWVASVDGANNDNCDMGDCGCDPDGLYVWAIDAGGNVSSACVGNGCVAPNSDGYQSMLAPQLLSPAAGATISDNTPLFTWTSVNDATSYLIQVSTNVSFDTLVMNTAVNSEASPNESQFSLESGSNLENGTYFWRVKGYSNNAESLWSDMGVFNLDYTAPIPTPSELTCTLETARTLIAQTTNITSMKCDIVASFGNQTAHFTVWQEGYLVRTDVIAEGQIWLYNGSSHCNGSYYYYPAENRAEIADSSTSPSGFTAPLMMIPWLSSPDAQLENCSFSCETYNGTECLVIQFPPDFDNVKLWLDMSSGLVIHAEITDEEEGVFAYDYQNIEVSDIPDSMFELPEGTAITGEDSWCGVNYDMTKSDFRNAVAGYASENLGTLPILTGTYTNAECSACNIVNMSALLVENGGMFNSCPDGMWQGPGPSDDNCDASGGSISGCSASNHYIWIIDLVGNVYSYCQGAECTSTNSGYQGVWP